MDSEKFIGSSIEDLIRNPSAFGAPTFEEFSRNREKWVGREDDKFSNVDRGSQILGKVAKKHVYEIEGFRCKTLEEVERVARQQGIPIKDLEYRAQLIPLGGGTADILIKFMSKTEFNSREPMNAAE